MENYNMGVHGYEESETGLFISEKDAYQYAMEHISQDDELRREYEQMVKEWFYSGNWTKHGFTTGEKVSWQSRAYEPVKTGNVIVEIPAGESAMVHVPQNAKRGHIKFDDISGRDRVLIAVAAGKCEQITHYYCPPISALNRKGTT